jgi:GDPmannose 4,6-dehydratase
VPRALITGITGQDGWYLTRLLLAEGYEVVGMVRAPVELDGVRTVHGDLGDPASLRAAVLETAPDELYHLAAPTFVPASWKDPAGTLALVAGATATLLQAARELDTGVRVLVAGSGEIFGAADVSPQNEGTPMRPRSPYGVAKLAAYGLVDTLREKHGLHASSAIAYNHESPRRPERFLPRKVARGAAAIKLGLQDELVLGDLDAVRDWCHARDIVRGYKLMLEQDEPGDYILAGGVGRTVGELVDAAFGSVGLDPAGHVRVDPKLVRPSERTPPVGDISRARERLGWEPETSFLQLLDEMVQADLAQLSAAAR